MPRSEQQSWFSGPVGGVGSALLMTAAAFLGREKLARKASSCLRTPLQIAEMEAADQDLGQN